MEMIYCNFIPNQNGRRRPIIVPKCFYLKGDLEIIQISSGAFLYDNSNHLTHFTGFMLDEEVVASL